MRNEPGVEIMWVKVEDDYYNTDHILSVEKKEDAGVYYNIRFADGKETGFNPDQIKPLLDALEKMTEKKNHE